LQGNTDPREIEKCLALIANKKISKWFLATIGEVSDTFVETGDYDHAIKFLRTAIEVASEHLQNDVTVGNPSRIDREAREARLKAMSWLYWELSPNLGDGMGQAAAA
jgi:hypothetical protein